jgi:hypothetical protein
MYTEPMEVDAAALARQLERHWVFPTRLSSSGVDGEARGRRRADVVSSVASSSSAGGRDRSARPDRLASIDPASPA